MSNEEKGDKLDRVIKKTIGEEEIFEKGFENKFNKVNILNQYIIGELNHIERICNERGKDENLLLHKLNSKEFYAEEGRIQSYKFIAATIAAYRNKWQQAVKEGEKSGRE